MELSFRSGPHLLSSMLCRIRGFSTGKMAASGKTTGKVSFSKTFFLVNSVYTNDVLNSHVHV